MSEGDLRPEVEIELRLGLSIRLALGALLLMVLSMGMPGGPGIFMVMAGLFMLALVGYQMIRIGHFKRMKEAEK